MVASYGLSDQIRNISFYDSTGRTEQALHKVYSEKTAEKIDDEVQKLVDESYKRTIGILTRHRSELDTLAQRLMDKEIVYKEELAKIFGRREDQGNISAMAS